MTYYFNLPPDLKLSISGCIKSSNPPNSCFLAFAVFLKVLAKAFLFGVHVDLVIGVQYPLCLGFTAFCIQFLELPPFLFLGMSLF